MIKRSNRTVSIRPLGGGVELGLQVDTIPNFAKFAMAARNILALCLVAVIGGGLAAWRLGWLAPRPDGAGTEMETSSTLTGPAASDDDDDDDDVTAPVPPPKRACPAIAEGIDREALQAHLEAFADIARAHEGNRAANTGGYDASVDYVVERLEAAGLEVTKSRFNVPDFEVSGRERWRSSHPKRANFARRASTGGLRARRGLPIPCCGTRRRAMCEEHWWRWTSRSVAATSRPAAAKTRTFPTPCAARWRSCSGARVPLPPRPKTPQLAGAKAAIIFNQGDTRKRRGLFAGQLIGKPSEQDITIPVLFAKTSVGETLSRTLEKGPVEVRVHAQTRWQLEPQLNVLTELPGAGDKADEVVMLGAHLDSVKKGPGINDNASGSAALLAIAAQLADCRSARTLRLAWWGAEERGLVGSTAYVDELDEEARAKIRAYINLDMLGSVNHVYLLTDGDGSKHKKAGPGTSGELEAFFAGDFGAHELTTWELRFLFRSDYSAFHQAGIGVAHLTTGASGRKKPRQAALFGGTTRAPFDPCYHKDCDDLTNVDLEVIETITRSTARAVQHFGIEGRGLDGATDREQKTGS